MSTRKIQLAIIALVATTVATTARAQEDGDNTNQIQVPQAQTVAQPAQPNTGFLIINQDNPSQIIILNSQGTWQPNLKNPKITINIGQKATMTCQQYAGPIPPRNIPEVTWTLQQIQSIGNDKFQDYIDNLQNDNNYVQKQLSN